jgi:ferredoxin
MTAVFLVLILYMLPGWIQNPSRIIEFFVLLAAGLAVDTIVNTVRFKKPACAVSAAVTSGILYILVPGVPLWGMLAGMVFGLVFGKHVWGGTGKNPINPAITGILFLSFIFHINFPLFNTTLLLLPAAALSIPFIYFRPYAAPGFMAGMALSLLLVRGMPVESIITFGVIFFGCLVITDPVTVTNHPAAGAAAAFLSAFLPVLFSGTLQALCLGILGLNIVSAVLEGSFQRLHNANSPFRLGRAIPFTMEVPVTDLAGEAEPSDEGMLPDSGEEILRRIEKNDVFGFGGAAYSTYDKIKAVLQSEAERKYLLINGVECDPGLIHDKWIMRKYPEKILKGIEALKKSINLEDSVLAVKDIEGLSFTEDLRIVKVRDFYPAGAERILIKEVLHRFVPRERVPAEEGILVLNVQTVLSIYEAVYNNKKADSRYLTAADVKTKKGQVVRVKLGTRVSDIVQRLYPNACYCFTGGGLMQSRSALDEDIVDKAVNFVAVGDFPRYKESPFCSRCGLCARRCPEGLKVYAIAECVDRGSFQKAGSLGAQRCISCGICSCVCLGGRNLSSRMKSAREYLNSNKVEERTAEE